VFPPVFEILTSARGLVNRGDPGSEKTPEHEKELFILGKN